METTQEEGKQVGMSQEASPDSGSRVLDLTPEDYSQHLDTYLELNPTDSSGYAIKIESLLFMGCYTEAFRFLEHSSALNPEMKEVLTSTYLAHGAHGFDISEAILGPLIGSPSIWKPDGDFIGPVEIKMTSNGCGRGLFATQNIHRGQVVLISKALAVSHEPAVNPNPLLQIVKDALNSCGEKTRQIFLSHSMKDLSQFIPKMSDFVSETAGGYDGHWARLCHNFDELTETVKDHRILSILHLIAFEDSSPVAMKENSKEPVLFDDVRARMYYGVWLLSSFVNHSCTPNAARINVGDILRMHATKPIDAGMEITIPYFNVLAPFPSRRESCSNFGFTCVCRRCKLEVKKWVSSRELQSLYSDYAKISKSEIENRASQLQRLVLRVEEFVKYFVIGEDERLERWYRASFMPVYLASITNRRRNVEGQYCLINETNFKKITEALVAVCPGSIHCLIFFQEYRSIWNAFLAKHGKLITLRRKELYEEYGNLAEHCMVSACASIYGTPHLRQFIEYILKQPIRNASS